MDISQTDNTTKEYRASYDLQLDLLAGHTVAELCDRHRDLLIFPQQLGFCQDGVEELLIFTKKRSSELDVRVTTGNLMGFVGAGDSSITICSRFAPEQPGQPDGKRGEDFFLHYMLQKVFSINLFDLRHGTSDEPLFDFMLYLFPYYLKRAMRQGLFRQYTTRACNDANMRGPVDLARQLRSNMPFNGKIAYRTREYSRDNAVTQLIRHTIDYIGHHPMAAALLTADPLTREAVAAIVDATPGYAAGERQQVIGRNLRPARHPYFLDYMPLQRLCLRILQHRRLKFGQSDDKVYGVLFDGAWLWEEYLDRTVLQACGFRHPRNRERIGGFDLFHPHGQAASDARPGESTFGGYKRFPDYLKKGIVLDAKYKPVDASKIDRNDMHQLISYMHALKADIGGLIYPCCDGEGSGRLQRCFGVLDGFGGRVYTLGLPVAQNAASFAEFCSRMADAEAQLREVIRAMAPGR